MELSTREIANRLGVTQVTVNLWCRTQPPLESRMVGNARMITETALVTYLRIYRPAHLRKWETTMPRPNSKRGPSRPMVSPEPPAPINPDDARLKNLSIITDVGTNPHIEVRIPTDEAAVQQAVMSRAGRAMILSSTGGWYRLPPINGRRASITLVVTIEKEKP
jgi:hypothetical protein